MSLTWGPRILLISKYFSGVINAYGAFQTYYELELLRDMSPASISWIGSIQAFCFFAIGVLIGPIYDAGHCYTLLVSGSFLIVFGFMMTSISYTYWQVFLAQGICIGIGTSCLSIPSIALVAMYFTTKRAWAMSIATLGSGLGSTTYPIIFQALQPRIGFSWTTRILGFISLAVSIFSIAVTRPRYAAQKMKDQGKARSFRAIVQQARLGEKTYLIYVAAIFFNNIGFYPPLYYLQSYALSHGGQGHQVTFYLLSILNSSSIPGRLAPSALSSRLGTVNTVILTYFLCAASVFYWTSASTIGGNIAFAVLYGFFSGGVVAFQPVVMTSITADWGSLGTRLGVLAIWKGVGSLIGPPIAGVILDTAGGYLGVQLFTGFIIMASVVFAIVLRLMLDRKNGIR